MTNLARIVRSILITASPLAGAMLAVPNAAAQTLNLDAPSAPVAGQGRATLSLADRMDEQADALRTPSAAAPALPDSDRQTLELRRSVRVLASRLLRAGEQAGEAGSALVVLGRTLALRIDAVDRSIRRHAPALPPAIVTRMVERLNTPAERIPLDSDAARRFLRDALAPLTTRILADARHDQSHPRDAGHEGVIDETPDHARESLSVAAEYFGLDTAVVAACRRLDQRLDASNRWPAYAQGAARLRSTVLDCLQLIGGKRPAWVTAAAADALRFHLATSLETLAPDPLATDPIATPQPAQPRPPDPIPSPDDRSALAARRLRSLRLMSRCAALVENRDLGSSASGIREAFNNLASRQDPATRRPLDPLNDADLNDRLSRIAEVIDTHAPRSRTATTRDDRTFSLDDLPRQLRPAFKPLDESRRRAAAELLERLPSAFSTPGVVSDPAFLQSASHASAADDDFRLLHEITQSITHRPTLPTGKPGTRQVIRQEYEPLEARLLLLCRGIASERDRESALVEFRLFAADIALLTATESLDALLAAATADNNADPLSDQIRSITANRAGELLTRVDRARADWADAVAKAREIRADALRPASKSLAAATLATNLVVQHARAAVSIRPREIHLAAGGSANELKSWDLSAVAAATLLTRQISAISAGVRLYIDGKPDEFLAARWEHPASAAVSALIHAEMFARPTRRDANPAHSGTEPSSPTPADRDSLPIDTEAVEAILQCAMGPPDPDEPTTPAIHREMLSVSRYLEELASAMNRNDQPAVDSLIAYLTPHARALTTRLAEAKNRRDIASDLD